MDFFKSQTALNLGSAFAGESQARTRYSIYAHKAKGEGLMAIASVFEQVAGQELSHASVLLGRIAALAPAAPQNLNVNAGYPFGLYSTQENLKTSAENEQDEAVTIYPGFAKTAMEEGFSTEATLFEQLAAIESTHSKLFAALANAMQAGTLYHSSTPVLWRCANCGHEQQLTDPWQRCPVCGHGQGFVLPRLLTPVYA